MAKNKTTNHTNLTKRQASVINRHNRKISGNINALMDNIHSMTYGIANNDKIDSLVDEFNGLMKNEIDSISKASEGDTTSFITKLFSENNKRIAANTNTIESFFNSNQGFIESYITEQYKNRLTKQADLHEVASQLVELQEAITITTDAIIAADIVDGHMSRTLTIDDDGMDEDADDYIPIIEEVEKKFELREKIKNFIIPRSLEYGDYYVHCMPYSKIFEDFSKEKNAYGGKHTTYSEAVMMETTLYDHINSESKKDILTNITESVENSSAYKDLKENGKDPKKNIQSEFDRCLKNISINNHYVPLCILEEGIEAYREYYTEFVEKTVTEKDEYTFNSVMKNIDTGIHDAKGMNKKNKKSGEDFSNIHDCYIKMIDPTHLLPVNILNETVGYYLIQEDDTSAVSGLVSSAMYYDGFGNDANQNNIINDIADAVVSAFDKKFLEKNMKFKKLIVECLNHYKITNKKIKFQFIPKEYIIPFKINKDENGNGVSIIEPSLFYAKLYLMILLFKIMTILLNSNDSKINYIRQSGIEKDVTNKIQEIARKKQQRQITVNDMFSYTTLIGKIGQGNEIFIPVGKSNERGIETEILSGQDVQLNTELLEMLKKAYISGTGVPDVLLNYLHEAEFAKTIELANNRFQGRVVSFQLDYNKQITELYKKVLSYSTTIPENIIESFEFNFIQPKYSNTNITNDLLNNYNTLQEFLVALFFGQDELDDEDNIPKIKKFKKLLAEERLPMLNFNRLNEIFRDSLITGTEEMLDPSKKSNE